MGRNNKSIHLLRGNKNNHPSEVLDSGQPFYDKYGRSIYIGDDKTSLSDLAPISGGWDYIDETVGSSAGYHLILSSTILSKIKTAGFLYCSKNGDVVAIQGLNKDDSSVVTDKWHLIYVHNSPDATLKDGAILAIGDTAGVFYGTINGSNIKWGRLTNQNRLSYTGKDSDTNVTLNKSSLIPSSSQVDLGSNDNTFNTIYTNRYFFPGAGFNFQYNIEGTRINDALIGAECYNRNNNLVTINTYNFKDGNAGDYAWIRAKGIRPYSNNEVNFDLYYPEGTVNPNLDITFGYRDSSKKIENYVFWNGQGSSDEGDRAGIKCGKINYYSYYNPDGAPLGNAIAQDISDNIKSINQRLYDLGFKRASLVLNGRYTGEDSIAGRVERWGNVVLVILEKNWSSSDELHIQKIKEEDSDVSFFKSISPSASALGESIGTIQVATLSSAGIAQIYFYNTYFKQNVIGTNAAVGTGTKFAYKAEPLK